MMQNLFQNQRGALRATPGAPPGELSSSLASPPSRLRALAYSPESFEAHDLDTVDSLPGLLEKWPVVWIRVEGLGSLAELEKLRILFNLHPLALEDVVHGRHRPKIEPYEEQLFFVLRMLSSEGDGALEQLSFFLGANYLITFHEGKAPALDLIEERLLQKRGRVRALKADYLAYCLVDTVVDFFYAHVDALAEKVDAIESMVIEKHAAEAPAAIHRLKRENLLLRRATGPLREAINTLIRDDSDLLSGTTRTHLRDCYDHCVHILEMLEIYRETLSGLMDIHLSSLNNRMSEVMRVLTVIATLFIPLTFLAGLYGMNFSYEVSPWNMPELQSYWGYPIFLVVMAFIAGGELLFFRKKGWLGAGKKYNSHRS